MGSRHASQRNTGQVIAVGGPLRSTSTITVDLLSVEAGGTLSLAAAERIDCPLFARSVLVTVGVCARCVRALDRRPVVV
ncbi:hypothetical protein GCM10023320_56870 [Pseudonocardia adelaidensis]|uniref:Uncharacterized protein n=1 Tax=Pseudonocardia adelaidensis TaxID=648754 RepID=A0ABP9NRI8_9PSEU